MSDKAPGGGFLDRWSARKRAAEDRSPVTLDEPVELEACVHDPITEHMDELSNPLTDSVEAVAKNADESDAGGEDRTQTGHDTLLLTDNDMPAIETLSSDSDLSGFFNKGVSAALRKAALRHVFQQPQYNVRDGLNDYDGDYTVFEPLGDTVTSDMKWHIARKERERLEAEARELEERERQALESLEAEDREPGPHADEEHETSDEELIVSQAEPDQSELIAGTGEGPLSSGQDKANENDTNALLETSESALGVLTDGKSAPKRVAGKLRRSDTHDLQSETNSLQVSKAGQEKNEKSQEHEE
ncbi:MAG: DUF3306 domain-containing protein [Granulosicoccus sp.]